MKSCQAARKKIFIAGCGGMLGEAFYKYFSQHYDVLCTDIDINEKWLVYSDFRNYDDYSAKVTEFAPDYLFHIGAHTDLEYCENNILDAYKTNTTSVENAVRIANFLNIPILYISTAGIFDGSKREFGDWDTPNPLGHYGRSKYCGERYVIENSLKYLVCRAGWMMGGGKLKDKKFIGKIMSQIINGSNELYVVTDKLGTPTYTHDFAINVDFLLRSECWELYNMVCDGDATRYDVAFELLNILGLSNDIKLKPVSSQYFSTEYFASRPPSEILLNTKLQLRGLYKMRPWKTCLKEYLLDSFGDSFK